jgi:hypothetical protein
MKAPDVLTRLLVQEPSSVELHVKYGRETSRTRQEKGMEAKDEVGMHNMQASTRVSICLISVIHPIHESD